MTKSFWNEERDNIIRNMFSERKTAAQVAEQLGVTRNAVLGRAFRLGLSKPWAHRQPRPKLPTGRPPGSKNVDFFSKRDWLIENGFDKLITDMREVGMKWQAIADVFGINYQTVRKYAELLGLNLIEQRDVKRFTQEDVQYIIEAWTNYTPVEDMADKLGRSFGTVRQKIMQLQHNGTLGGRNPRGTMILKRYGREALALGEDPDEVFNKLKEANRKAFAAGLEQARLAKNKRTELAIAQMHKAIAAGIDRNIAIFNCRSEGVHLERIAQEFDITRERVRQICERVAMNMAIEKLTEEMRREKAMQELTDIAQENDMGYGPSTKSEE